MPLYRTASFDRGAFEVFRDSLAQDRSLPLSEAIDDELFAEAFERHGVDFGNTPDAVYTPAITLWALVSQALFSGVHRSCGAAVTRVSLLWAARGRRIVSTNNGDYCRARQKIPSEAVRDIATGLADRAETGAVRDAQIDAAGGHDEGCFAVPHVAATDAFVPEGRTLLIDGFTVDCSDTEANQNAWPQNPSQKEGLGQPIVRCLALISLATGLLVDLAVGPYSGKETGETALFRQLLAVLRPGDLLVADRYLCTYFIIAACQLIGVEVVMRKHHKRKDDPAMTFVYDDSERQTYWVRPERPEWMSEEEYRRMPERLAIRMVDVEDRRSGFRTTKLTIVTTIMDRSNVTAHWVRSMYRCRWTVELDIRDIKQTLGAEYLRAKSPAMVLTELWSILLAYNLIRMTMLQSGSAVDRAARSMGFAMTVQTLGASWTTLAIAGVDVVVAGAVQKSSRGETVADRPGRYEPRANKRRSKMIALLVEPRSLHHARHAAAVAAATAA